MMTRMLTVCALILTAPALFAAQSFDESRAANHDSRISFSAIDGVLNIEVWDKNEWRLSGQLSDSVEEVNITGDENNWDIELQYEESNWSSNWFSGNKGGRGNATDLTLQVPQNASLDIELVSANVGVGAVNGERLDIETVSGDITSAASAQRVKIESVSGDVALEEAGSQETHLETVSGDIEIGRSGGRLKAESVSGKIEVRSATLDRADIESVSGDIDMDTVLSNDSDISISSHSGDLDLRIPGGLPLDLRIETFSGGIRSDWGMVEEEDFGPGERLSYREGSGEARLQLNSFSGDITIRER